MLAFSIFEPDFCFGKVDFLESQILHLDFFNGYFVLH